MLTNAFIHQVTGERVNIKKRTKNKMK